MGEETQPIAGLHRDIEELPHAELLTVLHENHDEQHLWDCIVAFEGYPFQTISGLPFSYQLKTGRNGELTKELWIDRRENSKSLAWSSVRLAFEKTEGRPVVARPKALGDIRGISYIYGIFLKFGLIEAAQKDTKKKRPEVITVHSRHSQTVRVNCNGNFLKSAKSLALRTLLWYYE